MNTREKTKITLELTKESDLPMFRKKLQEAFAIAVIETFGECYNEPIPPNNDVQKSFDAPGAVVYHIIHDGKQVGGAVLRIDNETLHNELSLFYVSPEHHGQGIGLAACGFHIVEFYNEHHSDPNMNHHELSNDNSLPGGHDFFRFEKLMKSGQGLQQI